MISDDTPILPLGGNAPDLLLRHCYEGCIVFGATGSGKTSGSGAALARGFLQAGLGGLVLCAKPDEAERWQHYARLMNREKDIVLFSGSRFNFLKYQQALSNSVGGGITENIVHCFTEAMNAFSRGQSQGRSSDPYWENASKTLLRNTIDLILLSGEDLTLSRICEVIYDTPSRGEDGEMPQEDPEKPIAYEYRKLFDKAINREDLSKRQASDAELCFRFFEKDFGKLSEKTKGSIISSFTSLADGLMRGLMADLLGTSTKLVPEHSRQGKIIIVDLDIMTYGELGKAVSVIFKTIWQKAMERFTGNPVFLFADESHFFQTQYDALFQSTCRGFKVCTAYLSQNKPGYLLELRDEHRIASLMGNLRNKFFHANDCPITNRMAAELIGKEWQTRTSAGGNRSSTDPEQQSSNWSSQRQRDYRIQPEEFLSLKTGGADFDNETEAIFFRSPNAIKIAFDQWPRLGKV
jgi:hypothetical protein